MAVNYHRLCITLSALLVIIAGVPLVPGDGGRGGEGVSSEVVTRQPSTAPPAESEVTDYSEDSEYEDVVDEGIRHHV